MSRAVLEITLDVAAEDRATAAAVYLEYKEPFLRSIPGAVSKELLVRDEDVQVVHVFESADEARDYLSGYLFTNDVVAGLKPVLQADPDVRIYETA